MDIVSLLQFAKLSKASDLHLVVGTPPLFRINGMLQPVDLPSLTPEDVTRAFHDLTSDKERLDFCRDLELDFGCAIEEVGRIRCNVARQRGTISLVIRLLPAVIPSIEDLNLPDVCRELILKPRGLLVVGGATGSGKSTTLAAMINYLNNIDSRRVVTIEDPIEYVYTNNKSTITQREIGSDTLSFAGALKHVLRQDVDVILIGEMRDLETASAALTIAETGHLVLTTGHAPSASQAIERVIDLFPPHERHLAQTRLASLLIGILCQELIPTTDGSARVPAVEVLLATPAVRNLIREGKIYQIPNIIRTQSQQGMKLLDQALASLYHRGLISRESVFAFCNDRNEVVQLGDEARRSHTSPQVTVSRVD